MQNVVRESYLPRITRDYTRAMVVNFARMSFSSLSFVFFQTTNRNLDQSVQTLVFDEDMTLHLQSRRTCPKHLEGATRIDREFWNGN